MTDASIAVRPFAKPDIDQVLALMRALATFEGYIDEFAVCAQDLEVYGLGDAPRFGVLVAETRGTIVGIAVHYVVPWTFDLRPTVVLKELFVDEAHRSRGVGRSLFQELVTHATSIGAGRLNWTVMNGNSNAERFYASLGAEHDGKWTPWCLRIVQSFGQNA